MPETSCHNFSTTWINKVKRVSTLFIWVGFSVSYNWKNTDWYLNWVSRLWLYIKSLMQSPIFSWNMETRYYNNLDILNREAGRRPFIFHPTCNLKHLGCPVHPAPLPVSLTPSPTMLFALGMYTCSWLSDLIKCLLLLIPHSGCHHITTLSQSSFLKEKSTPTLPKASILQNWGDIHGESVRSNTFQEMLWTVASFWTVTINMRVLCALGILTGMKTIQLYLTQHFPNLFDHGNHPTPPCYSA